MIELPFTSYYNTQGPIIIEVKVHLSNYADAGVPLTIYARGGFQYGSSQAPPVIEGTFTSKDITPNVFTVTKKCFLLDDTPCPEDETATGPSFPFKYVISADVDDGLTVDSLTLTDCLDGNLQFVGASAAGQVPGQITLSPAMPQIQHVPGGCVDATFPGPITGVSGPEATLTLEVYIPEFHSDGSPISDAGCDFQLGVNKASATGTWTPLDPRDIDPLQPQPVNGDADHTIVKKCLAIQKSVSPLVAIPGQTR